MFSSFYLTLHDGTVAQPPVPRITLMLHSCIVSIILPCKVGEFPFLVVSSFGIVLLNFTVISSFYSSYLRLFNSITEVGHTQIIHDSKRILLQGLVFSLHSNYQKSVD